MQAKELKNVSEAEVVAKCGDLFVKEGKRVDILPSVLMAQFILESGYGSTELAQNANNLFGMKCTLSENSWPGSTWDGKSKYRKKTQEDDGTGRLYTITADFRKYPCIEDSIADHSAYLLGAQDDYGYRYKDLKGCTDYERAVKIIKAGGYATDTTYVKQLCSIIERWGLTKLDQGMTDRKAEESYKILRSPEYNRQVPRRGNEKKYIVVHYLGVDGQNNGLWDGGYGAHYVVYWDGTIYQVCDHDAITWQVGTASGSYRQKHPEARNSNCIGIEMCCHNPDGYCPEDDAGMKHWYFTEATQRSAAWLVRHLMEELCLPVSHVLRHYDVVNKVCPAPYVYNNHYKGSWTWDEFLVAVQGKEVKPAGTGDQKETPFMVRVKIRDLNIRTGPGTDYKRTGKYTGIGAFTIVEVTSGKGSKAGWGRLLSGAGWISMDFTKKVD